VVFHSARSADHDVDATTEGVFLGSVLGATVDTNGGEVGSLGIVFKVSSNLLGKLTSRSKDDD
jgi:hypothetical protein